MTVPFRIGDDVQVRGDTWFAGATGYIRDVYPESGTLMVELEGYGVRVRRGLVLPFAPSEVIATRCQHPNVPEADLWAYVERRWSDYEPPYCPDCHEWLYPDDQGDDTLRVYVGEPRGAGKSTGAW